MGNPAVLAAFFTALGMVAAAGLAALTQRSSKSVDAADRAAERLEDARQKLVEVKDDHIAMLTSQLTDCQRQRAELAAKVAAYEARPARKDDCP